MEFIDPSVGIWFHADGTEGQLVSVFPARSFVETQREAVSGMEEERGAKSQSCRP